MAAKQLSSCMLISILFSAIPVLAAASLGRTESLNIIKELNRRGPYIGLVTVYTPEDDAFFSIGAFRPHPKHPFMDLSGRRFWVGKIYDKNIVYVRCGIGMVNAAAATQQMLDLFYIKGIVHFGIAGNANNSMSIADVTIPEQFIHTGLWDWLNPTDKLDPNYIAHLTFKEYNVPQGDGVNQLGSIGYSSEELFSESGKPNTPQSLLWAQVSQPWLQLAANLQDIELEKCVNSSVCLATKPKLVVGLRGSSANIFVNNAAYRTFLFQNFKVSSIDMESSAVVMTSLSNGFPVIVIRAVSDMAGGQSGPNSVGEFGPLAALNAAKVVILFVKALPNDSTGVLCCGCCGCC